MKAARGRLERDRISTYSHPKGFGVVFRWRGINRTAEQEQPFYAGQVITLTRQLLTGIRAASARH
jgi:hypothetical protein